MPLLKDTPQIAQRLRELRLNGWEHANMAAVLISTDQTLIRVIGYDGREWECRRVEPKKETKT